MTANLSIGAVAQASGVKVPTIRYYEQIGLLTAPPRTQSNRRLYSKHDLHRLAFIRHARTLGFEIEAIRALLALQDNPDQPCAVADDIARNHLNEIESRIAALEALRAELKRMVAGHAHGKIANCRVIEVLSDHSKCRHHP
ncbi:MerR family transcriptional regulator [Methylovirgula sp. 4M-Z18]|uniref:MerR family transcriptional regulator n=1 Tax=Methylovirgula sp. 4M-Z18 TaxID=2293567 RepID=UPI000E2FDB64|nr:helix-turn-helix domain-containing protein [Methylovirgula sp. 4M-Z18]RFB78982.1 MerR family transcriptional regulator [Methylovirgula sp. 4M-Z18]